MKQIVMLMACIICSVTLTYGQDDKSEVKIVDNYSEIKTISQLLSNFKGKPVFVDLWATWCDPCKEEFKFSDTLYQRLSKSGVQMLYVSLHKDVADSTWRHDLYKYRLRGNHVLANKPLQDAFTTFIWGGVDAYSIPHYLLFDANGNVLLKDALPPSSGLSLWNEIDKALSK